MSTNTRLRDRLIDPWNEKVCLEVVLNRVVYVHAILLFHNLATGFSSTFLALIKLLLREQGLSALPL